MFKESEYKMATKAKQFIEELLYDGTEIDMISDVLYWERHYDPKGSLCEYAMAVAALSLYDIADNGQWWTPSTRKVLEEYRKIKRSLSKGKAVYSTYIVTAYDWVDSEYIKVRIA